MKAGHSDFSNLSSGSASSNKLLKTSEDGDTVAAFEDLDSKIVHHNQPIVMSVFKDPLTKQEKEIIVAVLPGGPNRVCFSLVGSGPGTRLARIDYSWPPIGFEIEPPLRFSFPTLCPHKQKVQDSVLLKKKNKLFPKTLVFFAIKCPGLKVDRR